MIDKQMEMLTLALKLGITAPDSLRSKEAVEYAERYAVGLDETEVALCKMMAMEDIMGIQSD
tara:strand:+ start:435 stop:620 length:186 start_codon:yes stop_codon:yes gene_type:complete